MNERIRELAEQAGIGPWGITIDKSTEIFQKFAELIVRECSQIAHNSHPDDLPFVGGKMLVHFGVEE